MMLQELRQKTKMTVVVRMRPLTNKEQQQMLNYQEYTHQKKKNHKHKLSQHAQAFFAKYHHVNIRDIITINHNLISVYDQEYKNFQTKMKDYIFSDVFDRHIGNGHIFDKSIKDALNGLLEGYNSTILAYGITGSGKTFSIFGHPKLQKDKGLCYLASEFLLKKKKQYQKEGIRFDIKFSFLQIYNENVRDLLSQDGKRLVTIGEDVKGNISLTEASEIEIVCVQQLVHHISAGTQRRSSAATVYNQLSSRSHAVLKISIQIQKQNKKINTGSQKINNENSMRKNEGVNINKSLLTLGNCINALAENSKRPGFSHIPYRDSKLTRLLKDSLGGNSKIIMIACISPYPFSLQETVTTLNYAERAKGIKKDVTKNVTNSYQYNCLKCQSKLFSPILIPNLNLQGFSRQGSGAIGSLDKFKDENNNYVYETTTLQNELLDRLYNDIVENARELQKMERIKIMIKQPYEQYIVLQKLNQQIQINLKNTFFGLFKQERRLSRQIRNEKPQKKKIRLSNSTRKRSKQNVGSNLQKQITSKLSQSQKKCMGKGQENEYLILRQNNSNDYITLSNDGQNECLTSQRKRRSKVEIVKRPPVSNDYRRRRSFENTEFKQNSTL